MAFAIRKDGTAARIVAAAEDITPDEVFSRHLVAAAADLSGARFISRPGDAAAGSVFFAELPDPPPDYSGAIRNECVARISAAIGDKRSSMLSYLGALNAKLIDGVVLTIEERADRLLLREVDAWEGLMVAKREQLVATGNIAAARDDAAWPAKPAGLTVEWLAGF